MKLLQKQIVVLLFLFILSGIYAQDKSGLYEQGKYTEYETFLLHQFNSKQFSKLSKKTQIAYLTDLGKLKTRKKDYISALDYLLQAKKINKGDSLKYSHYNTVFGEIFLETKAFSIAIEYYKKECNKPGQYLNNYYQLSTVGVLFLKLNQADSATHYFFKQLEVSKQLNDYIGEASANNNIGIAKMKGGKLSAAMPYFMAGLHIIEKRKGEKNPYFEGEQNSFVKNILSNVGECYFKQKNYRKAIHYFEQCLGGAVHLGDELVLYEMLADSYLKTGQLDQAKIIVHQIEKKINPKNISELILVKKMQLNMALALSNVSASKKLIDELNELQLKADIAEKIESDQMNKIVSHFLIIQANEQLAFERKTKNNLRKKIQLDQRESYLKNSISLFLLIGFLVIGIVFYQLNKNKRRKMELEKQFLLLEDEKQKHKIKMQENYLTDFAIEKKLKDNNSKEIIKNLQHLKSQNDMEIKREIDKLIFDIKNKEKVDRDFAELNEQSELILLNFKVELAKLHPHLNEADINLCLLIKLNFSNKEIAAYKNITDASVKIFKNRLKKKMSLDAEKSLSDYIHNIL